MSNILQEVKTSTIPANPDRPSGQGRCYAMSRFLLEDCSDSRLQALCKRSDISVSNLLLGVYVALLYRYSDLEELSIGYMPTPLFPERDVRLLAIKTAVRGDTPFTILLQQLIKTFEDAEAIINVVREGQFSTDNNLFQALFTDFDSSSWLVALQKLGCNICFSVMDSDSGWGGVVSYDSELYHPFGIGKMIEHYKMLLQSVIVDPSQNIGALRMLPPAEEREVLIQFNDTLQSFDHDKTLVDLFEEQVTKDPDHIALQYGEWTLTYNELNKRANQLACYLVDRGVNAGDNVGLIVTRSFDMIIGMFAILKAGAAYVPIDPLYPLERQEYMLRQSGVQYTLTDDTYPLADIIGGSGFLNMNDGSLLHYSDENLEKDGGRYSLAYTIYTSGSTGKPKGVMIEHAMVVNLIQWVNRKFQVGPDDRLLFVTSMCFDLSVYDVFGILSAGATVVMAESVQIKDVKALQEMLQYYQITFWDSVPTTLDYLVRDLEWTRMDYRQTNLRLIFLSGDWIPVDLPDRIKRYFPAAQVVGLGGATEGTIWSNFYQIGDNHKNWNSIPYGRPIQNNFYYILNAQLQPVPIGFTGELYIGGVGVARGYAGEPEKTASSFMDDPFRDDAGGRMYRTGDLGRMSPDMVIEFIGRKDDQVKIQGFRVELGEVESALQQSPGIKHGVVLAKPNRNGQKRLVGYVVPYGVFDLETITVHLKNRLPDYLIPGHWVLLDNLPLSANGKIDKKALWELDNSVKETGRYTAPRHETDKILVDTWQEAMGIDRVGIDDNFFELGGHSLMAVQFMTKFEKLTRRILPLSILYTFPTIRQLADSLQAGMSTDRIWRSLVPIKTTGSKMPIYIVHGDGLNVLNFSYLAMFVDSEQPVYGLQARGLNGDETPLADLSEIAGYYIEEIIKHNPQGPYAIGGYSFGGFVAIEMRRQLIALGKEVKLVAMFDTDAEATIYNKGLSLNLMRKLRRQVPKFLFISKSFYRHPGDTLAYQHKNMQRLARRLGLFKDPPATGIYARFDVIHEKLTGALKRYSVEPFDGRIHLFRAQFHVNYLDDPQYLGWKEYARQGVTVYEVPGDHETMFQMPYAKELAKCLQQALDHS